MEPDRAPGRSQAGPDPKGHEADPRGPRASTDVPTGAAPLLNLLEFDRDGLAAYCEQLGEKRFRATQLFRWIHQKGVADADAMSDLALSLRTKLKAHASV